MIALKVELLNLQVQEIGVSRGQNHLESRLRAQDESNELSPFLRRLT